MPLAGQTQHAEQVGGLADGQGEVVEVEVTAQLHDGSAKQLGPQGRSSAGQGLRAWLPSPSTGLAWG